MEILTRINWVDILVVGIVIRIIYIGHKNGVIVAFFQLLAIIIATFITLHYYSALGLSFHNTLRIISRESSNFMAFIFLWSLVALVLKLMRDALLLLLKTQVNPFLDKWGGVTFAGFRSILTCSLLLLLMNVPRLEYWERNLQISIFRPHLVNLAPDLYKSICDGFIVKFFPSEDLNEQAFKLKTVSSRDKKIKKSPKI